MPANKFGFSLGEVLSNVENIKGARNRNKLAALQLGEAEREIEQRPIKEAAAKKRNLMITDLRRKAVGGDQQAKNELMVIDSKDAQAFQDSLLKQTTKQKEAAKANIDEMARMSTWVLDAKDENLAQERLNHVFKSMQPEVAERFTTKFKNSGMTALEYADLSMRKTLDMKTLMSDPKVTQFGDEDIMTKLGSEVGRTKTAKGKGGKGSSGSGGLKSSDESLMYRQAAAYFGGFTDPATGEMSGILQNDVPRAQAIAAEAAKIKSANASISISEAIQQAATKYGIEAPAQTGGNQYQEGQRIKNHKTGEIMIMRNGKWALEQ